MDITIIFGILIILFSIYVNQKYIKSFNIDAAIYKLNRWRRNTVNRLWVYFNTDKNTIHKRYTSQANDLYDDLLNAKVPKERFLGSVKKYKNSI
uniref:Uncharacterized protein n=1 Tax=viral metagenome TaxID=1070528 RepID=A0A6C0C367_9ZZZZ